MWRAAAIRGLISGSIPAALGLGRLHAIHSTEVQQTASSSNEIALLIAIISGAVAIIAALITALVPWYLRRLADRDPDTLEARAEATDALAEALVRANRDRERLEAERDELERELAQRNEP